MIARSATLLVLVSACASDPVGPAQAAPQSYVLQPYARQPYAPQQAQASGGATQPGAPILGSRDPYESARQSCLERTNAYRAQLGAGALTARPDKAECSDRDARGDAMNGTVHGESGKCGLMAQNECPSWPGTAAGIVADCLKSMFDEGPGEPYSAHGHFINMTNRSYRSLACGFFEQGGKVWLVQNYFP